MPNLGYLEPIIGITRESREEDILALGLVGLGISFFTLTLGS